MVFVMAAVATMLAHLPPPWDAAPLGGHLLPMFWMTLIAVYLYGAGLGAQARLAAPELGADLSACTEVSRRAELRTGGLCPCDDLGGETSSASMQSATGAFGDVGTPLVFIKHSLMNALVACSYWRWLTPYL